MRVKLAKSAGFCMGVRRAMNIALDVSRHARSPIYTDGPLIHNPQTIDLLQKRGINILEKPQEASGGTVIIRAHGIPPERRETLAQNDVEIFDATCPHVIRVQNIIKKHAAQGDTIVIVGDRGHAEVVGLLGVAEGRGIVVESREEVEDVPNHVPLCVVAQTTQDQAKFNEIAELFRSRNTNCSVHETICSSTERRQEEVRELCRQVDVMIVVGGRGSANTTRLAQISRDTGTPTLHVEAPDELDEEQMEQFDIAGITAGASTPNWIISQVVEKVRAIGRKRGIARRLTGTLGTFMVRSNLYLGLGAALLTYTCATLQGIAQPDPSLYGIAALYICSMYILNRFTDKGATAFNEPQERAFYETNEKMLIALAIVSALAAIILAAIHGWLPCLLVLLATLTGAVYSIKLIPKSLWHMLPYRRPKDIPASKDIFTTLAWVLVVVIIPLLTGHVKFSSATIVALAFTMIVVFTRSVIFDVRNLEGDRMVGKETIPIIIGKRRTKIILGTLCISLAVLLALSPSVLAWTPSLAYLLLFCVAYASAYLYLYHRRVISQGLSCEVVVDANFILAGLLVMIWRLPGG